MAELRLRLLGEIRLERAGVRLDLGSERQRRLLAALALAGPRGLTVESLVDRVWDEDQAPANPVPVLRTYVNRLRAAAGGSDLIDTTQGGYALNSAVVVDVNEFETLVSLSREPDASSDIRERALLLWDGPAFGPFAHLDWARPEAVRLEEQRLDTQEKLIESMIERGAHREASASAAQLLSDNPYRESLMELRMLSLYGDNRQAEALRAYDEHHERMVEDLGVYPSTALQTLNQRILEQDPTLDVAATPATVWRRHRMLVITAAFVILAVAVAAAVVIVVRERAGEAEVALAERAADSQRIMAVAVSLAGDDPELALMLAAEAQRLSPDAPVPFEVIDVIGSELGASRIRATFDRNNHGYDLVRYADISSDGRHVLVGDHDSFKVLDAESGSELWGMSTEGDGWFWFGYLANDETSVAIHRHHAASDITGFFYSGTLLRPDSTAAGVEIYSLTDGTLERTVPISETCPSNTPAPSGFVDASGNLLGYVDQTNGTCLEFGAYEVVVIDLGTDDEVYRSRSDLGSFSPFLTFGADRAVWFDADRGAHVVVELATGIELATISAEEGWSRLSPDGRLLAVVPGSEGSPLLYEVATGQLVDRLTGVESQVFGVWWDETSTRVFVASRGTLASWNVLTGEIDAAISDPEGEIAQGGVSTDGSFAAAVVVDTDLLRVWDVRTEVRAAGVASTSISLPGSVRLLSTGGEQVLAAIVRGGPSDVWGVADRSGFMELGLGRSARGFGEGAVLWQQGDTTGHGPLIAGNRAGEIAVTFEAICWSESKDGFPPTCREGQQGVPGEVGDIAISRSGERVAALVTTAGTDFVATTSVYVWSADGRLLSRSQEVPISPESQIVWVDDETLVTTSGWLIAANDGALSRHTVDVTALATGVDGTPYAGDASGSIHRLDRNEVAATVHTGRVAALAVGVEGSIASYGDDEMLVIVEPAAGTAIRRFRAGVGGTALAWVDETSVAFASGSSVTFLTIEDIDLSRAVVSSTNRTLTEAECEAYLLRTCDSWNVYVTSK